MPVRLNPVTAVAALVQLPCASLITHLANLLSCSGYLITLVAMSAAAPANATTATTVFLLVRTLCSTFAMLATAMLAFVHNVMTSGT
jgi:hypothetical protein